MRCLLIVATDFSPIDRVVDTLETLQDQLGNDLVPNVSDYFEDNYISHIHRNQCVNPKFNHALWNMYDRTSEELLTQTTTTT